MNTITRGRGMFIAGSMGLLLFGGVHVLAIYKGLVVGPTTPDEVAIHNAEKAFKVMDAGPFHATGWHTMNILNSSYSALLLYAGVLNLITVGPAIAAGRLRTLTLANIFFVGILLAITLAFQFPPPALFAAITLLFFLLSLARQRSAIPRASV